ncbi:MAG: helix-turn-helix transcriptional regulator [Thermoplasmata archaeon]|nr:helix-turn-helix transcriptional regulator [Thermoplasmata archaeon]
MASRALPTDSEARIPGPPEVSVRACPIAASLGTLGRKWTLTILRDIAFFPNASFSLILRNNPGLRQRTLSLRLKQLSTEELIEKGDGAPKGRPRPYRLTDKGLQLWPILTSLMQFGMQNYPERVFADGVARNVEDVYPADTALLLGRFDLRTPNRARRVSR